MTCPNPASEWIGAAGGRKRPRTGARRRGGARQPWRSCLSKRLPRRSRSYRSDGSSGSSRRRREEAGLLPNPLLPPSSLPALLSPSRCLLLLFQVRRLRRQGVPSSSTTTTTTGRSRVCSMVLIGLCGMDDSYYCIAKPCNTWIHGQRRPKNCLFSSKNGFHTILDSQPLFCS